MRELLYQTEVNAGQHDTVARVGFWAMHDTLQAPFSWDAVHSAENILFDCLASLAAARGKNPLVEADMDRLRLDDHADFSRTDIPVRAEAVPASPEPASYDWDLEALYMATADKPDKDHTDPTD